MKLQTEMGALPIQHEWKQNRAFPLRKPLGDLQREHGVWGFRGTCCSSPPQITMATPSRYWSATWYPSLALFDDGNVVRGVVGYLVVRGCPSWSLAYPTLFLAGAAGGRFKQADIHPIPKNIPIRAGCGIGGGPTPLPVAMKYRTCT